MIWFHRDFNNFVFVCKVHFYNCISNELCLNFTFGISACTPTALLKDEFFQNHILVLNTYNIWVSGMNEYELPYQYWIPKCYKNPYIDILLIPWMFYKVPIFAPPENNYSCVETSNVRYHSICQKWCKINVDCKAFWRTFNNFEIT